MPGFLYLAFLKRVLRDGRFLLGDLSGSGAIPLAQANWRGE